MRFLYGYKRSVEKVRMNRQLCFLDRHSNNDDNDSLLLKKL